MQSVWSWWRNGASASPKKEVLETIGRYVNENKIHKPCRVGVPGDDFFIRFKRTHKLSLKKPQSFEACLKKSYLPHHTFWRSNNVRRVKGENKGNWVKHVKDSNRQENRKQPRKRREWWFWTIKTPSSDLNGAHSSPQVVFNIKTWLPDLPVITFRKCYTSINLRSIKHNTLKCSITLFILNILCHNFVWFCHKLWIPSACAEVSVWCNYL
jgi:hypothetical protein